MKYFSRLELIDISNQARALYFLRLTSYILVFGFGTIAISLFQELKFGDIEQLAVTLIFMAICSFAAYTGWRNVSTIDPRGWRFYSLVFPFLFVLSFVFVLISVRDLLPLSIRMIKDPTSIYTWDIDTLIEFPRSVASFFLFLWFVFVFLMAWLGVIKLRRIKIASMNTTSDQILLRLEQKAGIRSGKLENIKRINIRLGLAYAGGGVLLILASRLIQVPHQKSLGQYSDLLNLLNSIRLMGILLLFQSRRYFQIDADSLLLLDQRRPILFLRSFNDDEKKVRLTSESALLDLSLELRFSNHFFRFGPFVAVDSPNRIKSLQLGAARVLMPYDEWQSQVIHWIRNARLIVMYSGKTYWVNWELKKILENNCTTQLIFIFPQIKGWFKKRSKEDLVRINELIKIFNKTIWKEAVLQLPWIDDRKDLRAILFRADGNLVIITSRARSRDSYHLAALIGHSIILDSENKSTETATLLK
jgi:hypothetical protein